MSELDSRLREALQRDAAGIEPDVERHLGLVQRSLAPHALATRRLLAAAAAFVVIAFIGVGSFAPLGKLVGLHAPVPAVAPDVVTDPIGSADVLAGTFAATTEGTEAWPALAGDWTLILGTDSSLALGAPAAFVASTGAETSRYLYALRGDLLFTNLFTRGSERGCTGPGTYRWSLANGRLSLEPVEDPCSLRITLLTAQSWIRRDG